MKVVLGMLFITLGNTNVQFAKKKLTWKTYTIKEAFLTTCWVKFIDRKEFAKAALDKTLKAFVIHISSLGSRMPIHPARKAQLTLLLAKKVIVIAKYLDFANVFLEELANILPKQTSAN